MKAEDLGGLVLFDFFDYRNFTRNVFLILELPMMRGKKKLNGGCRIGKKVSVITQSFPIFYEVDIISHSNYNARV
jgi:hypothetical protein